MRGTQRDTEFVEFVTAQRPELLRTARLGNGEPVEIDGRSFRISESQDYTTIATRTRPDEPAGIVRIQYPSDTGWTRETMLEFLAGVHVGSGAQQGLG